MRNRRNKRPLLSELSQIELLEPPVLPGITLQAEPLSRGPLSAVYRGWDQLHHHDVVVKVLQTASDPVAADRFRREASVMAQLRHPNIVALYQFHEGTPSALVMEYVPGQTLAERIAANGPLEPSEAARIIEEMAAALDCIHAENVVHRDIKPSNILLPKRGPARLTDFGVAHIDTAAPLTVRGDMLGTIEYASPEQVKGTDAPDARSDVYSLAAVAYLALTGTPPFRAADSSMQSQLSVMHQQVFAQPASLLLHRADLAPGIDTAVRRALAKEPSARYPSAGQFASALRSAVVASSGVPEQAAMNTTSRRNYALVGALVGAAALAGGGIFVWNQEQSSFVPATSPHASVASRPLTALSGEPRHERSAAKPRPKVSLKSRTRPVVAAASPALTPRIRPTAQPAVLVQVAQAVPAVGSLHEIPDSISRTQKGAVTERPKFRRHPALVAKSGVSTLPIAAKPLSANGVAWLSVYARQDSIVSGRKARSAAIPARLVTVDGKPITALAAGDWVALPSGKHLVGYVPDGHSGFSSNPGLWVNLSPGAHVSRQILLPLDLSARVHSAPMRTASVVPAAIPPTVKAANPGTRLAQDNASVAPTAVGWYNVSGWIVRNASAPKPTLVRTSAYWVKVDGKPVLQLAMGQWAELPAGKHTITFQPTNGVGVAAKTWDIDLPPQAHLDQQIPLPNTAEVPETPPSSGSVVP